jgi:hypothetical protein
VSDLAKGLRPHYADQVDLDQRVLDQKAVVPTVVRGGGTLKYSRHT